MKLSVSLTEADVSAVDRYAQASGLASRSAVVQHAIRGLGDPELRQAYDAAWVEWERSGSEDDWAGTSADGLGPYA